MFNEFLRTHYLEANADQKGCCNQSCVNLPWEGSKFCREHYLSWTPDLLGEDKIAIDELKTLFKKAASVQWFPVRGIMANVIKRVESRSTDIPASEIVNIDLEFGIHSHDVYQIGLANLGGATELDCHTRYSKGIIAP